MSSLELARAVTSNSLENVLEEAVRDVGAKRFALHLATAVKFSGESEETLAKTFIEETALESFVLKEDHEKAVSDAEDKELELERDAEEATKEKEETIAQYAKVGEAVRSLARLLKEASGEKDEDAILMERLRKENEGLYARIHELNAKVNAQTETVGRLTADVRELREKDARLPASEVVTRRRLMCLEEKLAAYDVAHQRLLFACKAVKQKKILAETAECLAAIERNFA